MTKITLDHRAAAIHAVYVGGHPATSVIRELCKATGRSAPAKARQF
jgi:hypothetical protein